MVRFQNQHVSSIKKQQNQVADEPGIAYENNIGLYEIFDYCEKNKYR